MKQQVNLFLAEFRTKKDPLTALLMVQMVGGLVAVMILASAYLGFTQWRLNSQVTDLRATLAEETAKTNEIEGLLARRSENRELDLRLEAAEARLGSSQSIRDFLSESKLGNIVGFSEYFKDLSRASIDGLSISSFNLADGGDSVSLSGQVLESAMVPRYVANIESSTSALRGQNFSPSITRCDIDTQCFTFELSSTR